MGTCPTCRAPTAWHGNTHRPFCSRICRLIDLGLWLDERYWVPNEAESDEPPSVSTHDDVS